MQRRALLATAGAVGASALAGCGLASGHQTLSDPTEHRDDHGDTRERDLQFSDGGDPLADFGMRATVSDGAVSLPTEVWHRDGTELTSIELRVRVTSDDESVPGDDESVPARVWMGAPFAGDGGDRPSLSLYPSEGGRATVIDVHELGDLRDETTTLDLRVEPLVESATTVAVEGTIELTEGGTFGDSYTLEGTHEFAFDAGAFE